MSTPVRIVYQCTECSHQPYLRAQGLRGHYSSKHSIKFNVVRERGKNLQLSSDISIADSSVNDPAPLYCCCACYFYTLEETDFKEHFETEHQQETNSNVLQPVSDLTSSQSQVPLQTKMTLNALEMEPFFIENEEDKEEVLAYTWKRNKQFLQQNVTKRIKTRESNDSVGNNYIHIKANSSTPIDRAISQSPYKNLLAFDQYEEIVESELTLLNTSWEDKSYLCLAISQLIAGSIIVTPTEALLINGVESYSRDPSVDAHAEKAQSFAESSVPTILSQYPNSLNICLRRSDKSNKLLIGSQTCNLLVVSSIRIDNDSFLPSVGPTTKHFKPTTNTKLYISRKSNDQCMSTITKAENRAALLLPQTVNPIQHLRQLRTKHDAKSAYFIGRWFSNITASTNLQPFTVYTLKCSPNHRQSSDAVLGSKILSAVARAALSSAHLTKESMAELSVDKPKSYKNQTSLQRILDLFTEDDIMIQNNSALAEILADVAAITTNAVKEANTSVANNIHEFFQSSMHV